MSVPLTIVVTPTGEHISATTLAAVLSRTVKVLNAIERNVTGRLERRVRDAETQAVELRIERAEIRRARKLMESHQQVLREVEASHEN